MDQLQIKLNRSGPSSEERDQKQPDRNAGARQEITVRGERESQRERMKRARARRASEGRTKAGGSLAGLGSGSTRLCRGQERTQYRGQSVLDVQVCT